ncbi:polysaccharide biosynthesis tyrosine autokinase [Cellulomonas oligotrophica]|uniref:non-specific protein-tyrosine kinase n=1 Tax=Cellulomonas oligotrophica TaxID=931536 RepID=A0A7Y9FHK8_9CELL|nr:polysaccharide biosynthesis tyrosine autokinase [Cellulomonas oligotrophica]NYD87460.1 capsular exopolysaccharide synthesis family protein [Cellulomonas oligotrophica]GIG34061.1 hypothetical protein Col01nite_32200 [Cellulomonas oligotrophica]
MEPAEYLAALRKHWLVVAVLAVLGFGAAYAWSQTLPPSYRTTSSVYVTVPQTTSVGELVQGSTYAQASIESYAQLATKPYVLDPVIDRLDLDTDARSLARSVTATSPLNSKILEISAVAGDPDKAASIANAVSAQLATAVEDLEGEGADGAPNVEITVVAQAAPPSYAFSPNTKLNAATGLAAGLVLGVVLALARTVLDTRVRSLRDVRRVTGTAVLSTVRFDRKRRKAPLAMVDDPFGDRAEAYRKLRTNLRFLTVAGPSRSMVVTSSLPTEGKSTAAINLAIAMAEGGARVVLVDADLRRPSVARYLGLEGSVGLTTTLIGEARFEDVVQPWGDGTLHVLPAGQVPPNPSELLDSPAMADLLRDLGERYDVVILDSAPLLPVTDAAVLSRMTDGALVVVGCRRVHRAQLQDALTSLAAVEARVLGLLLNQVSSKDSGAAVTYGSTPQSTARAWPAMRRPARRAAASHAAPPRPVAPPTAAAAGPSARRLPDEGEMPTVAVPIVTLGQRVAAGASAPVPEAGPVRLFIGPPPPPAPAPAADVPGPVTATTAPDEPDEASRRGPTSAPTPAASPEASAADEPPSDALGPLLGPLSDTRLRDPQAGATTSS